MRTKKSRLLSILLTLALVLSLMPGMALKVDAYTGNPYAGLVKTTTSVMFNDMAWYIIADNSTAVHDGSLTLLAKECIGSGSDQYSIPYANSNIRTTLDAMTGSGGSFEDVADAIKSVDLPDVNVSGAKLYLPSADELSGVPSDLLKCNQASGAKGNRWWLRSTAPNKNWHAVKGDTGEIMLDASANWTWGVRPVLVLDLSKVSFDSNTNTFMKAALVSKVTFRVVNGAWDDETTADKTVTLTGIEGDTLKLTADQIPAVGTKPAESYTAGSWNVTPSIETAITKATTYTYTYAPKTAQKAVSAPVVKAVTGTSITVKTVSGQQYSIDGGKTWKTSGTFKNLTPGKRYSIVTRKSAAAGAKASPKSAPVKVKTLSNAMLLKNGLKIQEKGNKITVNVGKVPGATSCEVYVQYCGGTAFNKKPTAVIKNGKTSVTISKINGKAIQTNRAYKVSVVAKKGTTELAKSLKLHGAGSGSQNTDVKSLKLSKTAVTLKKGKTFKPKVTLTLQNSKKQALSSIHDAALRFQSSDSSVATVDKSGKITARGTGVCVVQVMARNGITKSITVTVK